MSDLKNTLLNVEGMTCSNCALGIKKQLEKKGLDDVDVNFSTGEVLFKNATNIPLDEIKNGINSLGYKVVEEDIDVHHGHNHSKLSTIEKKFYFSLIFTVPLFLHMFFPHDYWINNSFVQLGLCLPVFIVGFLHFGKSALGSLKTMVPNMDVLIVIGATSAFIYSIIGTVQYYGTHEAHNYLFFETAATIISLVLLGNVLEHRSVTQTTTAIKELTQLQKSEAIKILADGSTEKIDANLLVKGDIILVNHGDKIAIDGEIIWGDATINESMVTGESAPVEKSIGTKVVGGTIVESGSIKVRTEHVGSETVLSKIIEMVKSAQQNQPNIQQLGDKVSAVFVPIVIGISILTFVVAHLGFDKPLQQALMQSIAVLVISCPCAMGLATPTAVMVGIGRAAKKGILIKGGNTLEQFANIKNIVFDKTGTLTTGNFVLKGITIYNDFNEAEAKNLLFSIEEHSSHPIAKSLVNDLKQIANKIVFEKINEVKGYGIEAFDKENNYYQLGSSRWLHDNKPSATHQIYLFKNKVLVAGINIEDELKQNVKSTITLLHEQNLNTVLLSGDVKAKCESMAHELGIKTVYSEQLPEDKLKLIDQLVATAPTAMVGDGINDAPALTKADVGISLSNATQIAVQSAQIVLLNHKDFSQIYEAYLISKHTLKTIKQNLFWAFFYNVVAIPIAAVGFLNPMIAALAMAFSDVIVVGNSIRLKTKKLK
ncbi:MAG: heavy metal translocating P-type ATPase [Flavobacteriales bacterium]